MTKGQAPRVFIERQLMMRVRPSRKDEPDKPKPAVVVLEPKTPVEPPVRVLSFQIVDAVDAELIESMRDLPDGPIGIEAPANANLSLVQLQELAAALDRDLIVRRIK
jgi:hypothetical protein